MFVLIRPTDLLVYQSRSQFISHDLSVVRHMASRIGVQYLGRLVEVAEADQLFHGLRHPYSRMLLDAIPDVSGAGRKRQPVTGEIPNPLDPPTGCSFHPRCPIAQTRCSLELPPARGDGGSMIRCWSPLGS